MGRPVRKIEKHYPHDQTVEEYPKLKKDDRDRAKDKGGFVGGYLKGNRRKRETVVCRSMLTMDADHAEIGFIDRFASECRYSSCLYTTHGHTPEQPRCRIIVPLTRDITPDEYVALARYFASDWGIDQFDECSYKPSQLMYWPTTPANGEFISKTTEGEWLDPMYISRRIRTGRTAPCFRPPPVKAPSVRQAAKTGGRPSHQARCGRRVLPCLQVSPP